MNKVQRTFLRLHRIIALFNRGSMKLFNLLNDPTACTFNKGNKCSLPFLHPPQSPSKLAMKCERSCREYIPLFCICENGGRRPCFKSSSRRVYVRKAYFPHFPNLFFKARSWMKMPPPPRGKKEKSESKTVRFPSLCSDHFFKKNLAASFSPLSYRFFSLPPE